MIWAVLRKDWALLWPLAVLVTLIQVALEWATYQFGFFGVSPVAREIMRLLTPAWFIGVISLAVVAVHEDTIPGVDQDWLIRPLSRTDLLLSKLLFVAVTVCGPMLVVNIVDEMALGFRFAPSFGFALYKELYLFVCLLVPAAAVAAATRNAVELVVLIAGLVLLYVLCVGLSALVFGLDRCPTCDTSILWIQSLLEHFGILVGSAVVLGFQYYERRTSLSRLVLAAGVVLLVIIQLPWNVAFAIQTWMGTPIGTAPAMLQVTAGETTVASSTAGGRSRQENAKRAAQALLQGDVDAAVEIQQSSSRNRGAPVTLSFPLQVKGMGHDEFLAVDRADFALLDARGQTLYRGRRAERKSAPLNTDAAGAAIQAFEMPAADYQRIRERAVSLVVDYSLTVRAVVAQHKMRATGDELRSPEIGICRSDADPSSSIIRCRQIGRAPNCYTTTLYGPDGRHNPEVRTCGSDYRPYIPAPMNIISFAGMEMPIRDSYGVAHYDVDGSQIQDSYIVMKVYETGGHFQRRVTSHFQPE
ncbi:MAG: hypothetical protein JSR66_16190 [Proteobacteria bacterium]|nr:hypothetical protein [Pseudomonadota bacterium]